MLTKYTTDLAKNFYICPFFLLLCLMFIIEIKPQYKTMYILCSACHRLWNVIQFSHTHNMLEIRTGDEGAKNMVTWHPHSHYIRTEAHFLHSPLHGCTEALSAGMVPHRLFLILRMEGKLARQRKLCLITGSTPPVKWLDEGTADSFVKRTWDSESNTCAQILALSITQQVTLNQHNLAESFP